MDRAELADPRFPAAVELVRRCGAGGFQIRWSGRPESGGAEYDEGDPVPVVWIAIADFTGASSSAQLDGYETAAGMTPLTAVLRLADQLVDGAICLHCKRPTGVSHDFGDAMPLSRAVCWYQFDPELSTYRRSCEGDTPRVRRNEPCPCGSGKKFKQCHGVSKGGAEST